jgi:hypothetical protein
LYHHGCSETKFTALATRFAALQSMRFRIVATFKELPKRNAARAADQ